MSSNRTTVDYVGEGSLVALLAERLAVTPGASAPVAAPAPAAPARRYAPDLRTEEGRALLVWGLWLRAAFVGGALVLIAAIQLATAAVHPVYALLLGAAGGIAATYSWRRVQAAVAAPAPAAPPEAVAPDAAAAR